MANHKSSEKRARSSARKQIRNHNYLANVRTTIKKFKLAVQNGVDGASPMAQELFGQAQSLLAKAAGKGILHNNNAARRIARLAKLLKSSTKVEGAAPAVKVKKATKSPAAKGAAKAASKAKKKVAAKKK